MLTALRRAVRRLVPRRTHPVMDARLELRRADVVYGQAYLNVIRSEGMAEDAFVAQRYQEGCRWRHVLRAYASAPLRRVLDLGGGSGATELALAADDSLVPMSVETTWNDAARLAHRSSGVPFRRVIADARALPFRESAFDAVTCLETIEHIAEASRAGREMSRVLRRGGLVLLTTPPRLRYVFKRDPHFELPGLVALPPGLQRWAAARAGHSADHHFVDRIYTSVSQVTRLFPGCRIAEVLTRSRLPRRWFWDAILLRRES